MLRMACWATDRLDVVSEGWPPTMGTVPRVGAVRERDRAGRVARTRSLHRDGRGEGDRLAEHRRRAGGTTAVWVAALFTDWVASAEALVANLVSVLM